MISDEADVVVKKLFDVTKDLKIQIKILKDQ